MDKYKVRINSKAVRELDNIYEYIAFNIQAPENARDQVNRLKKEILKLSTFPESHQVRDEGRYAGKGYRQLLVDNYLAIFKVDDMEKIVTVITVQYQGRNN